MWVLPPTPGPFLDLRDPKHNCCVKPESPLPRPRYPEEMSLVLGSQQNAPIPRWTGKLDLTLAVFKTPGSTDMLLFA